MSDFQYDKLIQKALVSVVRDVLEDVAQNGLTNNHHFYIRFRTDHPRVSIPAFLKERHPEEVMIVIQYQYWNLKVYSDHFVVNLSFNGVQETLNIAFDALTAFVDPSVKFALQFTPSFEDDGTPRDGEHKSVEINSGNDDDKIISFDQLRKK